ncbi:MULTISPECIES: ImmA/IrrE family metallo-endopeptidase [unclassified Paenibacillus]|uniref:ImmA/IrrE family metallo-endopeptidase n=1 Tax=unclassified Paenibacillus TaxID=185978 RepID=UPI0024063987|nr:MULTISPECIES: ImmA/IrrE family metallo-endopeptidase [unclassified Paenibacillus]MDF9844474.1 Zn-dependent peptidase ImmA (M78 family) [Paenibacillus sp. PastF-2]MDF9851078.1 Zn-dependent peptidase ImmA (M78 family) [Paenibacillus sp. PastM-2]MDF9857593.1 Zn-dependent peptidase ImmA (M78 family) [Paenibacillus sp. PastF-1]MDH6482916.1 Zn-dependent peptidase ImmA (M78 family) [Paenibacillus sp. PastH-2]MDH6510341.1 Zn-dependent peptidase ImmA (M78 family) [Paenibacillus sp. PastM-3]
MFKHYKKTLLEQFIETLYIEDHIFAPEHITLQRLAEALDVYVQYSPISSRAYESDSGVRCILIDSRLSPMKQRLDFLHELCHILRHAGNQLVMPVLFIKAQERDAEHFVLYASMPYFMIQSQQLPGDYNQTIQLISDTFGVPKELAKIRFDQILRREYEGELTNGLTNFSYPAHRVNQQPEFPDVTKIFAYYDPHSTFDGPDQLIIRLDYKTLTTQYELPIPRDVRFQELEWEALKDIAVEPTISGDIVCFDGQLTLQIHRLVFRYGLSKNTFVMHMRDVEQIIETDQRVTRKFN